MSKQEVTNWIRIARTGTFKDSRGREHSFTERDFDEIKAGYKPEEQQAALCFGHPKDSDPAFGWVEGLKREGGDFFARFARVPAQVKKLVDDGHYRYVSMSLSPDKKRLLHVGLLGAAAPAIEGLGPVSFSEADEVTINFSAPEQGAGNNGGNMTPEELQKQIIELQKRLAEAQAAYDKLKAEKEAADSGKATAEKQAADVAAEFSAFKGKIATAKREERVRALVKAGKLEPAKEKDVISFAAALSALATPVNFSAADGKTEEITAEERYLRELEAKEPSALNVDFSAAAPASAHGGANQPPAYNLSDITSKL